MQEDLDERAYDLLRLIRRHEPIGSIRLVDLMQRHGYTIQGRRSGWRWVTSTSGG